MRLTSLKPTKKIMLAGTAIICLLSGAALAGPPGDTDGNGEISKAEFMAASDARFTKSDSNGDGLISKDERMTMHAVRKKDHADRKFAKMDANNDGVISRAEFDAVGQKHAEMRKARRDINKDGVLDEQDRKEWKSKRAERKKARKDMRKNRKEMRKTHKKARPDANGDGFISFAEHQAASEAMFLRLDANADGVLSEAEGKRGRKHKRKRRGAH